MFTCVVSAQQEDKGLGKGKINNNQGGGNEDGTVKNETKGGVNVVNEQEQTQKNEKKGNVDPNNQQNQEKKGQPQEQQKNENNNANDKSNPDKPVKEQEQEKNKDGQDSDRQKKEQNSNNENRNNGNAYGKDKGGLTGQEFGKLRSEEAKTQVNTKIDEAVSELDMEFEKLNKKQKDIDAAKIRNEEKYKNKSITKEQYDINKAKIGEAENIVNQSKDRVLVEKDSLKKAKQEIK